MKYFIYKITCFSIETYFIETSYYTSFNDAFYIRTWKKLAVSFHGIVKILSFSHLEGVRIDDGAMVGPFARLRPGTILEKNTKVGNFVEVKKSRLRKNSK